jgi:hypothetical protein
MNIGSNARRASGGDVQIPNEEELDANAIPKASTSPSAIEATASISSSFFNGAQDFSIEGVYHIQCHTANITANNGAMIVSKAPICEGEVYQPSSRNGA